MKFETFDTTFLLIFEIIIILQFVLQNIRLVIPYIKFDLNKYTKEHGRSQPKIKRRGTFLNWYSTLTSSIFEFQQ